MKPTASELHDRVWSTGWAVHEGKLATYNPETHVVVQRHHLRTASEVEFTKDVIVHVEVTVSVAVEDGEPTAIGFNEDLALDAIETALADECPLSAFDDLAREAQDDYEQGIEDAESDARMRREREQ